MTKTLPTHNVLLVSYTFYLYSVLRMHIYLFALFCIHCIRHDMISTVSRSNTAASCAYGRTIFMCKCWTLFEITSLEYALERGCAHRAPLKKSFYPETYLSTRVAVRHLVLSTSNKIFVTIESNPYYIRLCAHKCWTCWLNPQQFSVSAQQIEPCEMTTSTSGRMKQERETASANRLCKMFRIWIYYKLHRIHTQIIRPFASIPYVIVVCM